jgi:hypothetical protein
MKLLVLLMDPVWMIIIVLLVVYVVSLRRRMAGLNDPRLYLSKGERRAWARKELEHREEQYAEVQLQKNLDIIQGKTPIPNQEK